jgi:hypothetical protein
MFKGWTGELKTSFVQKLLLNDQYRVFNNLIIPSGPRTTQMDHVIVSKYGLFAIETKDKTGWIFGDPDQAQWTQVLHRKKFRFQNPLRQNFLHTKSLSEFLGIPRSKVHSLIIFWGNCEFKTPMPANVMKGGLLNAKYTDYISSKSDTLLADDEVDRICSLLKQVKDGARILSSLDHVRTLNKSFASDTQCPRCGAGLVERVSGKGRNAGQTFLGCQNYPKCRYAKST